jgi:hypothetical protein
MRRSSNSCKRPSPDRATFLDHALAYASRRWSIIPTNAKLPACPWKPFQLQRPDDETLRRLFAKDGITGLAVILGPVSGGLTCRDFDVQAAFDQWAGTHPDLARCLPTVATARGRHLYFHTSGATGIRKLPDGELRCSGGYCLLPPALHPSGPTYRWVIPLPEGELPSLDPFTAGLCNREDRVGAEDTEDGADTDDGVDRADTADPSQWLVSAAPTLFSAPSLLQAVEYAIAMTLPTTQGRRNRCIFRLARHLKGIPALHSAEAAAGCYQAVR